MKKPEKMTNSDLVSIIRTHRRDSLGVEDGELSSDRARAMDHYHGRPYGNEQEGRSQVVSRDLAETVGWALPGIMRVFTASGSLGEFDPVGPEDEQLAQQESDYCNHVIMSDNPGFMILHDVIKDTLIVKNGYVKHYWEESEKISDEEYSGLTMEQVAMLMEDLSYDGSVVEIKEHEAREEAGIVVFDLKLQIKCKIGKCVIEAVPAEEIRVSKRCRGSLQDSPFVEHVTRKTRSDLVEMGMDKDFVYSLPAWNELVNSEESYARDSLADETDFIGSSIIDRSMDEIEYCEAYLRVDFDGDGIAELRKIVTVSDKIPDGEEWNEPIEAVPVTGFVGKRVPHRHVGESLDDELADLQEIKTVLMRQLLDNIYLNNNQQYAVNDRVNLTDMLQSLPGGIKRVQGNEPVSGSIEPLITVPILDKILPVIGFMDQVKESRTGISRSSTGLDPDTLKQSTKGAFLENLNRASQKVEMITRLLAESGVKEMMLQVHALLIRHQDRPKVIKLRGEYVAISPQEWKDRTDLTVRVGLGTGNEEEKREKLMLLSSMAERIAPLGLVGPQQAYNLFSDLAKGMGFDIPGKYALDPASDEFQQMQQQRQGQTDPAMQAEMAKMQLEREKMAADAQVEAQKAQANIQQEQLRSQNDITIEREKIAAQAELERYKAQLKAETDLAIAEMQIRMKSIQQNAGFSQEQL